MAVSLDRFSTLVESIYQSALDDSCWDAALEDLVDMFGATACTLIGAPAGHDEARVHAVGLPAEAVSSYHDYYRLRDPAAATIERAAAGAVFTVDKVVPHAERPHSELFVDWCVPNNCTDAIFTRFADDAVGSGWLVLGAPARKRSFAEADSARLMRLLVPHLQRATRSSISLAECQQLGHELAGDVLELCPRPAAVLGRDGIVLAANTSAIAMLADGDGLGVDRIGRLKLAAADTHAALVRHITIASGAAGAIRSGGAIAVQRPSGRSPYRLEVLPLRESVTADGRTAVLVAISDPAGEPEGQHQSWRRRFGLTATEVAVAEAICRGQGLRAVAEELGVSVNTVRTHQQHIFQKTQTHRQAELVRLLLAGK